MRFIKYFLTTLSLFTGLNGKNMKQVQNIGLDNVELLDIYIHENLAFVPGGLGGLNILDISDPNDVHVISEYSAYGCDYGRLYAWTVSGNFAYGAGRECGIKIIDISSPSNPTLLAVLATSGSARDLDKVGNYIIVAVGAAGVDLINVSDPENPIFVDNYNTTGFASRISASNSLIAVSDWDDVEVLQISDNELSRVGIKNNGHPIHHFP